MSDPVTVSTALLNQRLVNANAPRMLTGSEIELLRESKQEIAARVDTVRDELRKSSEDDRALRANGVGGVGALASLPLS